MSKRHIHKYHKVLVNTTKVWACGEPECYHFMPDNLKDLIPGRASKCWSCEDTFILDPINMKDDKPICINCKAIREVDSPISQRLNEILGDNNA